MPHFAARPVQRPRLDEIRYDLIQRIAEAEREGWKGEAEGLLISLTAAEDKLAQLDAAAKRKAMLQIKTRDTDRLPADHIGRTLKALFCSGTLSNPPSDQTRATSGI